jgi:hypothetical protein
VCELVVRLFAAFGGSAGGYVGWGEMSSDVSLENCRAMLETIFSLQCP